MKLAILLPSLKNVGPVRVAYDTVCGLMEICDIDVTVFYLKGNIDLEFPCKVKKFQLLDVFNLYSFDIIHSHMIKPDLINAFLPFYKGKKISTIHNIVETDLYYSHGALLSKIISKFWLVFWKRLTKCVVLSNFATDYYVNFGLNPNKLIVIYNGVSGTQEVATIDDSNWKLINDLKKNYTVLGSISLFNHRKGLDQVIKALPIMKDSVFVIIGDGPAKVELQYLAKELGVESRVVFLGFLNNARTYLKAFDIYMMPSREEGWALALLDAVVAEVPTVCSNIPVFLEAFEPNEVSFFTLDDITSLVNAVTLLSNSSSDFANNAKLRFQENYTQEIMTKKYFNLYLE